MKKLFKLLLTIVVICGVVYFAPKLIHKCDGCEKWFVGTGYEANVIADVEIKANNLNIFSPKYIFNHLPFFIQLFIIFVYFFFYFSISRWNDCVSN